MLKYLSNATIDTNEKVTPRMRLTAVRKAFIRRPTPLCRGTLEKLAQMVSVKIGGYSGKIRP